MSKEAKQLKASYVEQIKEQYKGPIITEWGTVKIELHFADKRKRDWDNYHKLSMDALEGTVIENDNQLDCVGVNRYFGSDAPRIELELKL